MARLTRPDFSLPKPNLNDDVPDTLWWLWLRLKEHVGADLQLGGIIAWKSGFHSPGAYNAQKYPNNYSIRDGINKVGLGWNKSSAIDLTFNTAHSGNYKNIDTYTSRLMAAAKNPNDPRLDMFVFEFYGQDDNDRAVEGWNEYREEAVTSDSSHLWHIHISAIRSLVGSWWGVWALYTVLVGMTVAEWRATLPPPPERKMVKIEGELPTLRQGDDEDKVAGATNWIKRAQAVLAWIAGYDGKIDGDYGPKMSAAVKKMMEKDAARSSSNGTVIGAAEWRRLYGIW